MEYRGYKIEDTLKGIIVKDVKDFNPVHVFECGQCFRWIKQKDGSYTGVVKGKIINVNYKDGMLEISNTTFEDFTDIWYDYFDLGTDYSYIKSEIMKDPVMEKAIDFGYGIRILRQDIWETLISFIISANNRIPMIMKVVDAISKTYGNVISYEDKDYYSFPSAQSLAQTALEKLELCRGGFRCKYIIKASEMIENGEVKLKEIAALPTAKAREELTKFPGVGNKVADCTLLYSGTKYDVFPTDVWVKRIMGELYLGHDATFKEIQDFASDYFGDMAGFAQQYLFYYARENKIGTF